MWVRAIVTAVLVLVAWFAVGTLLTIGLRAAWPEYIVAEKAMQFDLNMMYARLSIGAVCTIVAASIVSDIMRSPRLVGVVASLALLALFVPVHAQLWDKFPVWYHATFLVSLPILSLLGAQILAGRA